MPDFGSFRAFGDKLVQGQTPTQLGLIGSVTLPNFVLDFYPSSQVAYSLRKLRSTYIGNAIKVRRSSDNTEQDIGFTFFGDLDTTALLAFTGTGASDNGFVTTWYDQSGNANNATQSTAGNQPQIVSSGSVILENTKPTISFLSGLSGFGFATFSPTTVEGFLVVKTKADPPLIINSGFINIGTNTDDSHFPYSDGNIYDGFGTNLRKSVGNPTTPLNQVNLYNVLSASGEWTARLNTTQIFTTSSNVVAIHANPKIAAKNSSFGMSNFIGEFIIYPSNQSANRSGIESNINTYYAIY
jgi:hypothetical protein